MTSPLSISPATEVSMTVQTDANNQTRIEAEAVYPDGVIESLLYVMPDDGAVGATVEAQLSSGDSKHFVRQFPLAEATPSYPQFGDELVAYTPSHGSSGSSPTPIRDVALYHQLADCPSPSEIISGGMDDPAPKLVSDHSARPQSETALTATITFTGDTGFSCNAEFQGIAAHVEHDYEIENDALLINKHDNSSVRIPLTETGRIRVPDGVVGGRELCNGDAILSVPEYCWHHHFETFQSEHFPKSRSGTSNRSLAL